MGLSRDALERFNEKWEAVTESGCWIWTASTDGRYGVFSFKEFPKKQKMVKAHHAAIYLYRGLIALNGQVVMHTCDNTFCCNPDHLKISTQGENMKDMAVKGRSKPGRQVLSEENVLQAQKLREGGLTVRAIAELFGISEGQMSKVTRGLNNKKYT